MDQIRDLQSQLSCEKDQHLSLTQELDSRQRLMDSQQNEREAKAKEELANIKGVRIQRTQILIFILLFHCIVDQFCAVARWRVFRCSGKMNSFSIARIQRLKTPIAAFLLCPN